MSREAAALPLPHMHGEDPALPQRVFLFENHDEALLIWRQAGVSGRILAHIDPHHDMGWVPPGGYVTFANYICSALQEGLVRAVYWIVPEQSWEGAGNRRQILRQLRQILRSYPDSKLTYRLERRRARLYILGKPLEICSLSSLPDFAEPVLLDLDLDFLTLPRVAYRPAAAHTELPWIWPEDLVAQIAARKLRWDIATIPYSVEGGYTPLRWKYLGRELALRLKGTPENENPLQAMARLRAGAEAAAREEWDKASQDFEAAAALWPDSAAPWLHLALIKLRRGELDQARSLYQQALAHDPTYRTAYNNEGLWHYWNGNYQAAAKEFRSMLDLDPGDATALIGLSWLALREKRWNKAEGLLRRAIERDPENLDAWRALGRSLARQENYAEAITAYERSLQLALSGHSSRKVPPAIYSGRHQPMDDEHWPVFVQLGQLYEKRGQKAAALQRYRMALAGGHDELALRWRLLCLRAPDGAEGMAMRVWHCAAQIFNECRKPLRRVAEAATSTYEMLRVWWGPSTGKSTIHPWQRFRALPRREKALLLKAGVLFPVANACLLLAGYRRTKRWMGHLAAPRKATGQLSAIEQLVAAERVTRLVSAAELWCLRRPTCLERSLVLWRLLREQGLPAQLHVGARKNGQRLEAHAWVECEGAVLNDTPEVHRHYSRFDAPIAADEAE